MYSFQAKHYASYQDVPSSILSAFMEQNVLTETIRVYNGNLLFWEEHYLRLMASMRILRMDIPLTFTLQYLEKQLLEYCAINENEAYRGLVKLHVVASTKPTAEKPIPPSLFSITAENSSDFFFV